MARYTQILDNDAIVIPLDGGKGEHRIKCCDCGLIHHLTFEIKYNSIIMRPYRDNRATGQARRHMRKDRANACEMRELRHGLRHHTNVDGLPVRA